MSHKSNSIPSAPTAWNPSAPQPAISPYYPSFFGPFGYGPNYVERPHTRGRTKINIPLLPATPPSSFSSCAPLTHTSTVLYVLVWALLRRHQFPMGFFLLRGPFLLLLPFCVLGAGQEKGGKRRNHRCREEKSVIDISEEEPFLPTGQKMPLCFFFAVHRHTQQAPRPKRVENFFPPTFWQIVA